MYPGIMEVKGSGKILINLLDYQSEKYAYKTPANKRIFSREQGNMSPKRPPALFCLRFLSVSGEVVNFISKRKILPTSKLLFTITFLSLPDFSGRIYLYFSVHIGCVFFAGNYSFNRNASERQKTVSQL